MKAALLTIVLELKTFVDTYEYNKAIRQAARYGRALGLTEIWLLFFVETIDDENRQKYETEHPDVADGVTVKPLFVTTGIP